MTSKKSGFILKILCGPGGVNVILHLVCGDFKTIRNALERFLDSSLEEMNNGLFITLFGDATIYVYAFEDEKVIDAINLRPYIRITFKGYKSIAIDKFRIEQIYNKKEDCEFTGFYLDSINKGEKVRIDWEDFSSSALEEPSGDWQWDFELNWEEIILKEPKGILLKEGDDNIFLEEDEDYVFEGDEDMDIVGEEFRYGVTDEESGMFLAKIKSINPFDFTDAEEIWWDCI